MLFSYILLVYSVTVASILLMCLENSLCFYAIVLGTTMFNFVVYQLVSFIVEIVSAQHFSPEKYANTTLVSTANLVRRFERHHADDLARYNIKLVVAEHHSFSMPEGKPLGLLAFKHSPAASEGSGSVGSAN